MDRKKIERHARKYFKRVEKAKGFGEWNYGFDESVEKEIGTYVMRMLEKKNLLGQETRGHLYQMAGECALKDHRYQDARRYFLLAGKRDLLKEIESEREKWIKLHRIAMETGGLDLYKNN